MAINWSDESRLRYNYNQTTRLKQLEYIQKIVNQLITSPNPSVIDFGCSHGYFLNSLKKISRRIGIDTDKTVKSTKSVEVFRNFSSIKTTVDLITFIDVAEHLEANQLISQFEQAYSHLKNGGYMFVQTVNPYCLYSLFNFYEDLTHVRPYGPIGLSATLQVIGFKPIELKYVDFLFAGNNYQLSWKILDKLFFFVPPKFKRHNYLLIVQK